MYTFHHLAKIDKKSINLSCQCHSPQKVNGRGALIFMYGLLTPTHTSYFLWGVTDLNRQGTEATGLRPAEIPLLTTPQKMGKIGIAPTRVITTA